MANDKLTQDCLKWITDQQNREETSEYGEGKRSVSDALRDERQRNKVIHDYKKEVDKVKSACKDPIQTDNIDRSYAKLQASSAKRIGCLESLSQITNLEELFGTLSNEFSSTATSLVSDISTKPSNDTTPTNGCTANSAQNCILAVRSNWSWVEKMLKSSQVHLNNAAEYHQFFHEVEEYEHWMPTDLHKAEELLNIAHLKRNSQGEDASKLLMEMKAALTVFLHWRGKINDVFEKAKKVIPVHLRTTKLDHQHPVKALCNYETEDIRVREGEELTLLDNSKTQTWQVRNMRAQESQIPSVILVVPGPDPTALDAAMKLRLQFLSLWTNMVKRVGKTIIRFLLQVVRDWTPDEENMLKALSKKDKDEIEKMLKSIESTFSPLWDLYPPYKKLKTRIDKLRDILSQTAPNTGTDAADKGRLLIIQTGVVNDLLDKYKDYWKNWETFKVLTETTRHPEYLLVVENWEEYKFLDPQEWLKKWQTNLALEDDDDFNETGDMEERIDRLGTEAGVSTAEDEIYTIETAKETAETSHLTTSEQEERQTFVITAVIDPRNDEEISLDRAVSLGIINQREGKYVNPQTREAIPIPMAMNAGKIKVEFTTTKKSEEKRRDMGLITIKTFKESRPFTVKGVIDVKTYNKLGVDEAVRAGVLDLKRGIYKNANTHEELSLSDALDSGLLIVEFDSDADVKSSDPEVVTKTYAVHAVVDVKNKKRVSFAEGVQMGLINQDTGAYYNSATGESLYVGEAIKKGFIKAIVVKDTNLLNIDPANRITLADENLQNFKQKLIQPGKTVSAFKHHSATPNGTSNGSK